MADFITPIIDILTRLYGCCTERADSIRQLGDNLTSLGEASNELKSRYLDVKMKAETAQQDPDPELMVLNEVMDWMSRVEDLQNKVSGILQQGDQEIQANCFGGRCPKNCRSSYKLNKMVTQKLSDVNGLISKGHFDVIADKFARDRFDDLPVGKAVGIESTFEELRSCFENNQVGIIGLYGMGGVGKTTLLKNFNNDFLSTIPNYVVIWVVVSKDVDPEKIQDSIRKKLRVEDNIWDNKTVDERIVLLYNILKKKQFVLLLDDVWERIDLLKLGVPSPNDHECKIIFTTRSREVCSLMEAKRFIKINCLSLDIAFVLFKEKVGETTLESPHIVPLAKQVVKECQGLPLALCTVGRAMSNKATTKEWERAIEILRRHPSKIQAIEDVYYLLEFSYDTLPDSHKSCFLYCSLFPEDHNIPKEELISLWIAEGYLSEFDYDCDIHQARKQGEDIISSLQYACLLENGEGEDSVKMHDVTRGMALWVACDHDKRTRFFVRDCLKTNDLEACNNPKWKEVEKLSMWGGDEMMTNLPQKPHCPNLITLLIRHASIQVFPTEAFILSNTIRVLDLTETTGIRILPSAIGDFVNLEYMNLSFTGINKLPEELKNLKKLRFLLLDGVYIRESIPKEVISNLSSLQAFSMRWSSVDEYVLCELEGLDYLQEVQIFTSKESSVERILKSSKLHKCLRELSVQGYPLHDLFSLLEKMEHLETFNVLEVSGLKASADMSIVRNSFRGPEHRINLHNLILTGCDYIVNLNWLIHIPNLQRLELNSSDSLVEVISEDFGTADTERMKSNLFSNLSYLHLYNLPNLRSICRMTLQFPCLKEIAVSSCDNLKKLPFNSQSALKNLQLFQGETPEWFDQFQWEDEATKHLFLSKFERTSFPYIEEHMEGEAT